MTVPKVYILTEGDDVFPATGQTNFGPDSIEGLGGNDLISAGTGNNTVFGGSGDDTVTASDGDHRTLNGHQYFDGGDGNDVLLDEYADTSKDRMYGGAGDDTILGGGFGGMRAYDTTALDLGQLVADGGDGNDFVIAALAHFTVAGGSGQDMLRVDLTKVPGAVTFDASAAVAQLLYDGQVTGTATGFEVFDINGGAGNDMLTGGDGADTLSGFGGDNTLSGGGGNDSIFGGGDGSTVVYCGSGDDFVYTLNSGVGLTQEAHGGAGDDLIKATHGAVQIWGDGGDDTVAMMIYQDVAGTLRDQLYGGAGFDTFYMQAWNFETSFDTVAIRMVDGVVRATVNGVLCDLAFGFEKLDLQASAGQSTLEGGAFDDKLAVANGAAVVFGRGGDDKISVVLTDDGTDRAFALNGGVGTDVLTLNVGVQKLELDAGKGTFSSGALHGTIKGFESFAIVSHGAGDVIHLGDGNDIVQEAYSPLLSGCLLDGQGGDDTLLANSGADTLLGGAGNDLLRAGGGKDAITGGLGTDTMAGGHSADVFVWTGLAQGGLGDAADRIMDFEPVHGAHPYFDRIDVSAIDATGSTAWNAPFKFIGTAEFTAEGQIRVEQHDDKGYALVQFNTLGTSGAEMEIRLYGTQAATLTADNFVL